MEYKYFNDTQYQQMYWVIYIEHPLHGLAACRAACAIVQGEQHNWNDDAYMD